MRNKIAELEKHLLSFTIQTFSDFLCYNSIKLDSMGKRNHFIFENIALNWNKSSICFKFFRAIALVLFYMILLHLKLKAMDFLMCCCFTLSISVGNLCKGDHAFSFSSHSKQWQSSRLFDIKIQNGLRKINFYDQIVCSLNVFV